MKFLTLGLVLVTATAATAQTSTTSTDRWAPWLGCWQVAEESVGSLSIPTQDGARVCVTPAPDGGATMTTLVNDKALHVETMIADGKQRPLTEQGCRGSQTAEWSRLAPRIYAHAEIACGDQPTRKVSGLAALVAGPMWLDVQTIESEGRKSMRVRRYRRAAIQTASPAVQLAQMPLGEKLTLADIKEASTKVAPETLQAAVMELGGNGYDLDAKQLIELDTAGVPDSVIDLMVAMSFPRRFVVERATGGGGAGGYSGVGDPWSQWGYWGAWSAYSMWPYYSHPYYYSSYFSPFGYRYWGYYDPTRYYGPGFVIVDPGGGNSGAPNAEGRVVNGQGYTRIRRNEPEPTRNGGQGSWGGASTSSTGSSGSGSSGVSTGGYSSGGASSGGDRTAVPRPPGGN